MKKVFITIFGILFTAMMFAQGTIGFYTNNGSKKVSQIKCGNFDNLKVKMTVPSYVKKFDRIKYKVWYGDSPAPGIILYDGAGSIAQLLSNPHIEKWILKPGKQAGDFYVTSTAVNNYDLCGLPREEAKKSIQVIAEMIGYNKTGTKKYWDDFHKEYRYKTTYTSGTVIAKGRMTILQQAAQTGYVSKNGIVSVEKVTKDLADEYITGSNNESPTDNLFNKLNSTENFDVFKVSQDEKIGFVEITFVFFDDEKIKEQVNNLFHQIPADLDPYGELKRDLLQFLANKTNGGKFAKPFFKWPFFMTKVFCPFMDPKAKLKTRGNYFTNMEYWSKKKMGDYEFDYLKIPKCYSQLAAYNFDSNTYTFRKPAREADTEIYATRRGNTNVFIFITYEDENIFAPSKDPNIASKQKEFVKKTFAVLKFLK